MGVSMQVKNDVTICIPTHRRHQQVVEAKVKFTKLQSK